jgi:hypothetical protein
MTTAHPIPSAAARARPRHKACPFPWFTVIRSTPAPAAPAASDVPSVEASSTTMTRIPGMTPRTPRTTPPIAAASLKHGMTTAQHPGQSMTERATAGHRREPHIAHTTVAQRTRGPL